MIYKITRLVKNSFNYCASSINVSCPLPVAYSLFRRIGKILDIDKIWSIYYPTEMRKSLCGVIKLSYLRNNLSYTHCTV